MVPRHNLTFNVVKLTFKQSVTLIYDTYLFLTQIRQINVNMEKNKLKQFRFHCLATVAITEHFSFRNFPNVFPKR